MIQQTFQHRSGRVISLSRVVLSAVFLIGLWLDPGQPAHHPWLGYGLLTFYLASAAVLLAITWNDWRLETRLALPALALDLVIFTGLVLLTGGYANPFFPFFVFIILSAALRWSWRETAVTAAVLIALFLAASAVSVAWEAADFNPQRFFFRSAFLVVLSFVLVWFGLNQLRPRMPRLLGTDPTDPTEAARPPIHAAARFVMTHTGARRVVFAWWNSEEPWINTATLDRGGFVERRHGPDGFGSLLDRRLADSVFLFDVARGRVLKRDGRKRDMLALDAAIDAAFARLYGLHQGLAIPVESSGYGGVVFALDVPGLCSDDVTQGEGLGEEISAALERASVMALLEDAASARARLSLSRDLHDSVLQLLAGTSFRLEGVKKSAKAGRAIEVEIEALQRDLVAEQRDVRALIGQLRGGAAPHASADLQVSLSELAARMSRQWNVACSLDDCPPGLETSLMLERDCHQLVREAVANAVRHGRASRVAIRVADRDNGVQLIVTDNGSGFPTKSESDRDKRPWSLSERVRALGGDLALVSSDRGSMITISLPQGRAQ